LYRNNEAIETRKGVGGIRDSVHDDHIARRCVMNRIIDGITDNAKFQRFFCPLLF
jgi:cyanophycinase-like exopeptidase